MEHGRELSAETVNTVLEELHQQQQLLFTQAKFLNVTNDSIKFVLEETCRRIAKIMKCERVGIWLFNKEQNELTAQNCYDATLSKHSSGERLFQSDSPSYFKAIQQERTLAVDDVATHPATQDLVNGYFGNRGKITSMLDVALILSQGIGGVLCCETATRRVWTPFDETVIASLADMLSFLFDRLYRLEAEEHIRTLAYTDVLTGLDNPHAFTEKAALKIRSLAKKERGIFIYMILDQFTEVQATLGHGAGEKVLKLIADRLRYLFPEPALTSRIGFDHFIIFYPYSGNRVTREIDIDFITKVLREPMVVGGQEVYMTFSYGVSSFPDHVSNVKDGLQAAQVALEAARKKSPRKARGFYKPDLFKSMKETMLSEMNLRRGLDFNEFRLFYQPQVDCLTGEVIGFEGLIRWQHPERGLIAPGDFIELAESTGLIIPIGEWVIQEAFSQLAIWEELGRGELTISVNLSPRHFLHTKLPAFLMECATSKGIEPRKLKLEITENVALEDHVAVIKRINQLSEMGYPVSIDDFGTGYSAFIYLQHFPVQEIKIDRQFVRTVDVDPKSEIIIKSIVQLAQMLGLQTVAEGVENEEQWKRLQAMGCDEIQGFYFSKPLPAEDIHRFFASSKELLLPMSKGVKN
ncbi:GGDEF and EAL domain-containing protein [Sporosarcina sp. ACRSM]|uniref:sensor domain-containing phosphodiesterase n=1 Tax=Sporosarcina sp. ACRSM TaxID=2918216 RepID=UPI001EF6855D|nr:GGDEF and EAL domain-containing protein [Sporosarcina sp. ACRSM]MCG7334400.1 GGDEF and EAL domain-containing protein [Sporosarcina sp. ACRSM]